MFQNLSLINFVLLFFSVVVAAMLVYGIVLYIIASRNHEKIDASKKIVMYAFIGAIVILLCYAVVNMVLSGTSPE